MAKKPSRPFAVFALPVALALLVSCVEDPAVQTEPQVPVLEVAVDGTPEDAGVQVEGIDVDHHRGDIDWSQVAAAGKTFTFIKATEGNDFVDPNFEANWTAAKEAGLLRGAYHFFRPEDGAATQAENFLGVVNQAPGDLPPVLDVEAMDGVDAAAALAGVLAWLEQVEAALGVAPTVYTGPNFWNALDSGAMAPYPLWIAEYGVEAPRVPQGWGDWTFWQYSHEGEVAGVDGDVDLDVFAGTRSELLALTSTAPPPSPRDD
ncbi:MAG: GH25 family lysozyme [Acidobacteriota bacterium]